MKAMSELENLKREVAQLKEQLNPAPPPPSTHGPIDYTAGMSMPAAAIREMVNAVPDSLMRELSADARKPNPVSVGPQPQAQAVRRGSGWQDQQPLEPPPGIAIMDRMMDAQDRIDQAELALRLVKASLTKPEG
jgi:hypothetical protein